MTPERWSRINDLAHAALEIAPSERDAWLRGACGSDEALRTEVVRLLDQDERATRDDFPSPPESEWVAPGATGSWYPGGDRSTRTGRAGVVGFTPKAAIRTGATSHPSGAEALARHRLRVLAVVYLLITGLMPLWKYVVVGDPT